jgi:hypothetical protein
MHSSEELCHKISALYPDIGKCGIDITATYDKSKKAWEIDLKKDAHKLKHYLETPDADACMEGKQCVALGLEIAQLKKNIAGNQY